MLAVFVVLLMVWHEGLGEPPVRSSYLPPRRDSRPSSQYGVPPPSVDFNNFNNIKSPVSSYYPSHKVPNDDALEVPDNLNHLQPSDSYSTPFDDQKQDLFSDSVAVDSPLSSSNVFSPPQPSSVPTTRGNYQPSTFTTPSQAYGVPNQANGGKSLINPQLSEINNNLRSSFGGITSARFGHFPEDQMGSNGLYTSSYNGLKPKNAFDKHSNVYGGFNSEYSGDEYAAHQRNHKSYSPSGSTFNINQENSNLLRNLAFEPIAYEYEYKVQANDESEAVFGHRENRENEEVRGEYHVLLPDGKMQIVEYEANETGYRPRIRYEDFGSSAQRSGFNGY